MRLSRTTWRKDRLWRFVFIGCLILGGGQGVVHAEQALEPEKSGTGGDSPASAPESVVDPATISAPVSVPVVDPKAAEVPSTERPKDYREGLGFAGLPLINYNSDDGLGYGIKGALYDYGKNQKPYKTQIALQFFFTTKHIMYHRLYFDAPKFRGSPWRLGVTFKYDRILLSNYYGIGNDADVRYSGELGDDAAELSADEQSARRVRIENYYTSFQRVEPTLIVNLRRDLSGPFKLFNGYRFKNSIITPHTAETLDDYADIQVSSDWTSYLEQEKPYGYSGGLMGYAQLGAIIDSRNREPSPDRGTFSELSARAAYYKAGDSAEQEGRLPLFGGINLTVRQFFPMPVPRLVLATRLVADVMFGDVPFYELTAFGGSQDYTGLGGDTSMRGVKSNRYRGKIKVIATPELRLTPFILYAGTQKFDIGFIAYADVGRVWTDFSSGSDGSALHAGVGGGLRVAWNDNFLIRLDYGINPRADSTSETDPAASTAPENDTGFYLTFDHAF